MYKAFTMDAITPKCSGFEFANVCFAGSQQEITQQWFLAQLFITWECQISRKQPTVFPNGQCLRKGVLSTVSCSSLHTSRDPAFELCVHLDAVRKTANRLGHYIGHQSQQNLRKDDTANGTELNLSLILPSAPCPPAPIESKRAQLAFALQPPYSDTESVTQ